MYRRRLRRREIDFGFDSFLDLVANVIGVVVRFILVAWVGARSYNSLMSPDMSRPAREGPPALMREDAHPLAKEIALTRLEIERSRTRLLEHMQQLRTAQSETAKAALQVENVAFRRGEIRKGQDELAAQVARQKQVAADHTLTLEELRKRSGALKKAIAEVGKAPVGKTLRYRVPVSRTVRADEAMFECQQGRVTFIDLQAFIRMLRRHLDDEAAQALRSNWSVNKTTAPVGAFRMRYVVARRRSTFDVLTDGPPIEGRGFSYGLRRWELEPIAADRGETTDEALQPGSRFRALVEGMLPEDTVVTMWVYPDSFDAFRRLRDYLYTRGIEVAGRPLPFGVPIAASPDGTASRSQ